MTEQPDLTRNQDTVFAALQDAGRALTAYELLDQLRDTGIRAPTQVYRALEKLQDLGLVHRIESMNAFVACAHDHGHGHGHGHGDVVAFSICKDCGEVNELPAEKVERSVEALAAHERFATESAIVELRGHCAACSERNAKP